MFPPLSPNRVGGTVRVGEPVQRGPAGPEASRTAPPITGIAVLRTQKNRAGGGVRPSFPGRQTRATECAV